MYSIVDNFLPSIEHQAIESTLTTNEFPWYFNNFVAINGDVDRGDFYFEHIFYNNYTVNSNFFGLILPLINIIKPKALIKCKANLYPNTGKLVKNALHIDQKYSHSGALYYVNTNNGFTGLEDGTNIDSIANRMLYFDSSKPHHSTHCTDQKVRITININYF